MKRYVLIILLFLILTSIVTFPLAFNMNSHIAGCSISNEPFSSIWGAWWLKFSFANNISAESTFFWGYPFGVDVYANRPINFIFTFTNFILSLVFSPIATYNIQIVGSIFLTAFFTYLLANYITKNKLSSIVAGITFGFCPYIIVHSWQLMAETFLWPIPFLLWSGFRLREENKLYLKVIFVACFAFSSINFGVAYYSAFIMGIFLVYLMGNWKINKRYLGGMVVLLSVAFVILIPQILQIVSASGSHVGSSPSAFNPYHRPFDDLFNQAARPLSYFLPTVYHPLFGSFTEKFAGSSFYGKSLIEHALYLGWVPLVLGVLTFSLWKKKQGFSEQERFYIGFFVILSIAAWFFSQPPWWRWGPFRIFMPSYFMYKILPMFRAYCRFGVVVMFSLAMLVGFGMKFILERLKADKLKISTTILFVLLVLFEFMNYPPSKVIDLTQYPKVYDWVKVQPEEIVIAQYPLDLDGQNAKYNFYQTIHQKRMVNGTVPGSRANKILHKIENLGDEDSAGILSWLGADFVLLNVKWYKDNDDIEEGKKIEGISVNNGLRFVRKFDDIEVYQVIAESLDPNIK